MTAAPIKASMATHVKYLSVPEKDIEAEQSPPTGEIT